MQGAVSISSNVCSCLNFSYPPYHTEYDGGFEKGLSSVYSLHFLLPSYTNSVTIFPDPIHLLVFFKIPGDRSGHPNALYTTSPSLFTMLCHSYRLLGLLFAVADAAHTSKQPVYYNTTSLTSSSFPTNPPSSYGTVSLVSETDRSKNSKTSKHPHSKYSTATVPYSTGTSPQTTKTKKNSHTPTGSVFSTKSSTAPSSTTVSVVSSTTSSIPPICTPTSFKIQVTLQYAAPNSPPIEGSFLSIVPYGQSGSTVDISQINADPSKASIFSLNADCTLQYGTEFAALPPLTADYTFSFFSPATIASGNYDKTTCQISGNGLTCHASTGTYYSDNVFYTCSSGPYYLTFAPTQRGYQPYCFALLLAVVPI